MEDRPLDTLLSAVVTSLSTTFGYRQVAILLDGEHGRTVAASTGLPVTDAQLEAGIGLGATVTAPAPQPGLGVTLLPLAASGRTVGVLLVSTPTAPEHDREALLLFANQIALAVERVRLRESSIRARLVEQVDLLAKTLVAAVSHDLRTPSRRSRPRRRSCPTGRWTSAPCGGTNSQRSSTSRPTGSPRWSTTSST